ncbi:hypothetical protein Aperf_G00000085382 [Anoplocephala perfoliata]
MEELDNISFDESSGELPSSRNPLIHSIHISRLRKIQLLLFAISVFPIRLFFIIIFFLLTLLIGELATRGADFSRPFSGLRQHLLLPAFIFCFRAVFFFFGFFWVTQHGRPASCAEAPILVFAPHSSFFDMLAPLSLGLLSSIVTVDANSPPTSIIKMCQPIWVNKEDPASRQKSLAELRKRALSGGKWPQFLIFPEGTNTNRSCLINYKLGAFTVGCPVQPAILRWGYGFDSITTTWKGPGVLESLLLTALQPYTTLEIEFLPVYTPSEAEKDDPYLYAKNVRVLMAEAAKLPTTEFGYNEYNRIYKASQFNLPMASQINEYDRLRKYLFQEPRSDDDNTSSSATHVTDRILAMATAALEWYTVSNCEPLKPSRLAQIFLPMEGEVFNEALLEKVSLLKKIVSILPKTQNGQPDIRVLVVHLSFLMFSSSPSVAMQLAFQASAILYLITAFEDAPTKAGEIIDVGDDNIEIFTSRVISSYDAIRLLTAAYHLSVDEAAALLPATSVKRSSEAILEAITPNYLVQVMKTNHPKLLTSYEDYESEMERVQGHPNRGLSEASSFSRPICNLCDIDTNEETVTTSKSFHKERPLTPLPRPLLKSPSEMNVRKRMAPDPSFH